MKYDLSDKVALITGSSQGLGFAVVESLLAEGARVAICSRHTKSIEAAKARLSAKFDESRLLAVTADITDPQQCEHLMARTTEHFGRLDILVPNAGGPPAGEFMELDDEQWHQAWELNFVSAARLIRLAVPWMKQVGSGRIVTITSVSIKDPIDNLDLSNAVRPGVEGLVRTLARRLGPYQITVNNVAPGYTATERMERVIQSHAEQQNVTAEVAREQLSQKIALRRIGQPHETAAAVLFFASSQASYITGQTLYVDGGWAPGHH